MKIKPILFNTEMVRAILEGRKTVTRRVVKPQPPSQTHPQLFVTPPYSPGDILYVREPWQYMGAVSDDCSIADQYIYRADWDRTNPIAWRPSIHMPREAARIFLRVTGVRVERLQSITMSDIQPEGVVPNSVKGSTWQQWQMAYMEPVWDSTIKPADRGLYGWEANPWVWVIEFERISKEEAEN